MTTRWYARIALVLGFLVGATEAATNAIPWRLETYTLTARAMPVRQALETFGVAQGVPVLMSEAVGGVVSGDFRNEPAGHFLDRITTINNLVWYYDGASLYVYGASEVQTRLIDLRYLKARELGGLLQDFGVADARYPIKDAQNGELIMLSGPPRYVQLVSELIARADNLREMRTFNEVEVRLFPLTYTWADNMSISVSTPESSLTITGVAALLEDMTRLESSEQARQGTNGLDNAEVMNEALVTRVKPVIKPENRLNAVMVRDSVTRMPLYERIIRELDKPVKLVEVTITTLELAKDDAFQWQTSLSVGGGRNRQSESHAAGAGANVDNLMTPEALAGKGLSGAYSYVGDSISLDASVSALKQDGKTRNISRTALLTLNNFAASITDSQTYNARVTGERVANLQSVTAGTTFRVKPRAVKPVETNRQHDVWLTLEITDGGFQKATVDGMPTIRNTTLTSLTMLKEGQSLVLAGYLRDVESEAGWGIPWLRDIPWLGWLFGGQTDTKECVQRMFMITPRVIDAVGPNTVIDQSLRVRNVTAEENLTETLETSDDRRRVRRQDLQEARAIQREKTNEELEKRRLEIKRDEAERHLDRARRGDLRKVEQKNWESDFKARKEEYREEKRALLKQDPGAVPDEDAVHSPVKVQ